LIFFLKEFISFIYFQSLEIFVNMWISKKSKFKNQNEKLQCKNYKLNTIFKIIVSKKIILTFYINKKLHRCNFCRIKE